MMPSKSNTITSKINARRLSLTGSQLALWIILLTSGLSSLAKAEIQDLCEVPGCSCSENAIQQDLLDVICQCSSDQILRIGPEDAAGSDAGDLALAPDSAVQMNISGCAQVELLSKTFNSVPTLSHLKLSDLRSLVLHSRLYEARAGNGQSSTLKTFTIENVSDLKLKRHTFEGVRIDQAFMLKSVIVERTPSLAFNFDSVREFSIFGSRFDRVSMWGFKLEHCLEFNVLGQSRFFSLASQAFHMKCSKFMLAYNTFDNLHDSSLDVRYGLADIQGNTFEKLTGKPFFDLKPLTGDELKSTAGQSGLVFRENMFASDPVLPFNALAMPKFAVINADDSGAYIDIENNHFVCNCDRLAWFLGAIKYNFDRDIIANGGGSYVFLKKVYDTAGQCLTCGLRKCETNGQAFSDFASSALMVHKNQLKCSTSGQPLKSQNSAGGSGSNGFAFPLGGEEESLGDIRNMETSSTISMHPGGSTKLLPYLLTLIILIAKI